LLVGTVSAVVDVRVDVAPGFVEGEIVGFDYTFISDIDEDIVYTPRISCISHSESILENRNESLVAGVPVTRIYEGFEVTGDVKSQQCLAVVRINQPFIKVKEEVFEIVTTPVFRFDAKVCEDVSCSEESSVFVLGEEIYFGYLSGVGGVGVSGRISYPDGKVEGVDFPSSIRAEQVGVYELDVTALKSGYRDEVETLRFAVIEEEVDIETVMMPSVVGGSDDEVSSVLLWVLGAIVVLIVIVVIVLIFYRRKSTVEELR
jgi:hypothetical protein